jgi:hypothetical protein
VRKTWRTFRAELTSLVADGGKTITTSSAPDAPPYARTIVQLDGDSLWMIASAAVSRQSDLDVHAEAVAAWYRDTRRVGAAVQRYTVGAQAVAATVLAAFAAVQAVARNWIAVAVPLALSIAAAPIVRWTVGKIIGRRIKSLFS